MVRSVLRDIFGEKAGKVLEIAGGYYTGYDVEGLVNMKALLGMAVAEERPEMFREVASGAAIPSLTLAILGFGGEASDTNPRAIETARRIAFELGVKLDLSVWDLYSRPFCSGDYVIADTPDTGYGPVDGMEKDIVRLAIESGSHLALNPVHMDDFRGRLHDYSGALEKAGYEVCVKPLEDLYGSQILIARKPALSD